MINNGNGQINTCSDEASGCFQCDKREKLNRDAADCGRWLSVDRKVLCARINRRQGLFTKGFRYRHAMPSCAIASKDRCEKLIKVDD